MLSDTIYNNIKAGREDATEQEVIAAAKAAHCHEFIERLPNGYQTHLAEGGNTLSGGEKQRIAIARAILKDAPILLLDESTASLDADNEAKINQALDRLMKGKTVFVIAHRLNTIQNAEQEPVKEVIPMGLLDLLLVAVGLSMDAFAVSVCKGLNTKMHPVKTGLGRAIFWWIPGAYAYAGIYLRRNNSPVH